MIQKCAKKGSYVKCSPEGELPGNETRARCMRFNPYCRGTAYLPVTG